MATLEHFLPSAGEIAERGFGQTFGNETITRYEKRRPCPGGFETLIIEISNAGTGAVFFTRIAARREEMWRGWPLPSRQFYEELFDAFGW